MSRLPAPNDITYIEKISSEREKLILEMEVYARENRVPILDKTSSRFLEMLVALYKPNKVLEIGTAIGYSSILIAENLSETSMLDTIEVDETMYKTALENFEKSKNKSKINIIFDDAVKYLSESDVRYDMVFLDCDKEIYPELFEIIIKILKTGGVFIADNLLWHGYAAAEEVPEKYKESVKAIRNFNIMFLNNKVLKSELIPIGDGIGLAIKLA